VCGIIGYIGKRDALPILLKGLKRLEYRGYDSVGLALLFNKDLKIFKKVGKVKDLEEEVEKYKLKTYLGIAHTRWATHGAVKECNAHPQISCKGEIAIVHNGIIENYKEIKEELKDHKFLSETDSEVIAHIMEEEYDKTKDYVKATLKTVAKLKGSFAFLALIRPLNLIIGARLDSPLAIGIGDREYFLSSDVLGFVEYTDDVIFLNNREICFILNDSLTLMDFDGNKIKGEITKVAKELIDLSNTAFEHYTLKEIHEQPKVISLALKQEESKLKLFLEGIMRSDKIYFTGCGSSYHAALLASYLFNRFLKLNTNAVMASEFEGIMEILDSKSLVIGISQSGETADLLTCIREAKKKGARVYAIVNNINSSLAREVEIFLPLNCGPEVGVAATKSFTAQLTLLYKLSLSYNTELLYEMKNLDLYAQEVLKLEKDIKELALKYKDSKDFYFIGRGIHYPIALEGALKLKELSYIHAEGLAAGELKHGPLALISEGIPSLVINPKDDTYSKTLNNAYEIKARGAKIIGLSDEFNPIYDEYIKIPKVKEIFYPILEVIPLQLLAYYITLQKELNPDYPRNLAKSVTVT